MRIPNRKSTLVAATLLALLASCSTSKNDNANDPKKEGTAQAFKTPHERAGDKKLYQPISDMGIPVGTGYGVDLENENGIPFKCVDGTKESIPNTEGVLFHDQGFSQSDIEKSLGASADGKASFLKWGASARSSFIQKTRAQSVGLHYTVMTYNKDRSEVFLPSGRSEATKLYSSEEWLANCGSGYVAAQDYGSMLVLRFSLHLENKTLEQELKTSGSGKFSIGRLRADLNVKVRKSTSRGSLSVSAIQIGGKPSELGKILKSDDSEVGLIQSFFMCDVSRVDDCLKGLSSVEDYIAKVFPAQIADKTNGGSSLLASYPFKYQKNIGPEFNPGVDKFVVDSRSRLSDLYDAELSDAQIIAAHGGSAPEMVALAAKMSQNIEGVRDAMALCYIASSYQQCAKRAEELAISCAETVVPAGLGVGDSGQGGSGSENGD